MKHRMKIDMVEATRLTREGRFQDAMAVLRGAPPTPDKRESPEPSPRPAGKSARSGAPLLPEGLRGLFSRVGLPGAAVPASGHAPAEHAAPPIPKGARFETRSFHNEVGSRRYKLYVPSGYKPGRPLPLVMMLHGCTQSPDDFAAGTRMNELAEEQGFLVAYPEQTKSANASKCWNWFSAGDQQRERGEPSLIAGITRQIMAEWPVDPRRVYVAGLSAGGAAAAIMGATYPDLYAAVGVHSGLACGAARDVASAFTAMRQGGTPAHRGGPARPIPTIVFHGDRDATVNPVNGDQVVSQSKAGTALTRHSTKGRSAGGIAYTRTVESDAGGRPMIEQWLLHGAGHAWSGGSAAGSYTDPRGPDASREMARFFLQHPA